MISEEHLNQVLHCDCVLGMRALPDACIPLTVTSPPYDKLRMYDGHALPFELFQLVACELYRVTMPRGVIVWVVQDGTDKNGSETGTSFRQREFFKNLGMSAHATMIMKVNACRFPNNRRYCQQFHYAFVLSKGKPRVINVLRDSANQHPGDVVKHSHRSKDGKLVTCLMPHKRLAAYGYRGNVWDYKVGNGQTTKDRFAFNQTALMPELMAEDHILSWSNPGDLVFDPMCGAATTCKMALLNHRKFLGMEIHQTYWEIACKRMELAKQEHRQRQLAWLHGSSAG